MATVKEFLKIGKEISPDEIISKWKDLNVPLRAVPADNKTRHTLFLLAKRNGKITTEKRKGENKRNEEYLCMGIFNRYNKPEMKKMEIKGHSQKIVGYQIPIKATGKEDNKGWGKIDLVGLVQGSPKKQLVFWEMKWPDGEDPWKATLQLLAYAKAFDKNNRRSKKNLERLLFEIFAARGFEKANPLKAQPLLFVGSTTEYWNKHRNNKELYEKLTALVKKVKEELKFEIEYWDLGDIKKENIKNTGIREMPEFNSINAISPKKVKWGKQI